MIEELISVNKKLVDRVQQVEARLEEKAVNVARLNTGDQIEDLNPMTSTIESPKAPKRRKVGASSLLDTWRDNNREESTLHQFTQEMVAYVNVFCALDVCIMYDTQVGTLYPTFDKILTKKTMKNAEDQSKRELEIWCSRDPIVKK
ncbi:unnamed protein product [Aphanomyces euteiches]